MEKEFGLFTNPNNQKNMNIGMFQLVYSDFS